MRAFRTNAWLPPSRRHKSTPSGSAVWTAGSFRGEGTGGIRIKDGDKVRVLRDLSGKPETVNTALLDLLLGNGYTPVLTMPLIDENCEAINSENDDVVALLHRHLRRRMIVQLDRGARTILRDPEDPDSVIATLHPADIGGMGSAGRGADQTQAARARSALYRRRADRHHRRRPARPSGSRTP